MIFYRHVFCESLKLFFRSPRFWSERSTVSAKQSIIIFAFEWCIERAVVSRKWMREGFWGFNGAVSGVSITSLCPSGFYCIVVDCSGRLWTWRPYLALRCFVPLQHPPGSIAHRIGCLERSRLWLRVRFVVSVLWNLCCVLPRLGETWTEHVSCSNTCNITNFQNTSFAELLAPEEIRSSLWCSFFCMLCAVSFGILAPGPHRCHKIGVVRNLWIRRSKNPLNRVPNCQCSVRHQDHCLKHHSPQLFLEAGFINVFSLNYNCSNQREAFRELAE